MGFMKCELTSGNGFKVKAHEPAPEVALGGMEPDRCTANTRHTNQKISTRFILALGVLQTCKFLKNSSPKKSLIQIALRD